MKIAGIHIVSEFEPYRVEFKKPNQIINWTFTFHFLDENTLYILKYQFFCDVPEVPLNPYYHWS
jgi:hypothetical protein